MTSRTRNLAILGAVAVLLVLALLVILPGSPLSKDTKLGLDLEGGIELVYEARPTPQVPTVTQQAIDDAIETMRKRVDSLGVAEPEIQRSGREQIAVGLPAIQNAERAKEQVGTTAQLQFYDWEPNLLTESDNYAGGNALYKATEAASKAKGKAERIDVVPGSGDTPEEADRKNNTTTSERYYLFGPDQLPIGPDGEPVRTGNYQPSGSCEELLAEYQAEDGPAKEYAKDTECLTELEALGPGGPPSGSRVIEVPQGVVVVEQERSPNQPPQIKRFTVLEDDSELSGLDIKNPEANTDPNTNAPLVSMEFSDKGREAFARVTKRIAQRGFDASTLNPGANPDDLAQRFAITLDDQIVSLASIDFVENPEGIDGRNGAQIENVGDFEAANDLSESLRIGALPVTLKLISETQVSATLGRQALDQGLLAAGVGLALTVLFLLLFYRVLGLVATAALLTYAVLLLALVKLIPITLTLPGIAGLVLTLAVAADANIVMYERIKEEVREGRSIPAAISAGYTKALRTIIDANVVTVGVAFILFTLATAGVKGFAFTLGVGTLVSLFTAVLATSAILGSMARTRLLRRPSALGVGRDHKSWSFDFMGNARWFFSFSGVILLVGAIAISTLGIQFGIDFESGTRITTPLEQRASVDDVRGTLSPLGYDDAKIQAVDDPELGDNVFQISVPKLDPSQVDDVEAALDDSFGVAVDDFSSQSIGPTFGEQIAQTALIAVIASLLLISLYIGFRFEWKFAVPILIALAHDLLITGGVYALFGREVTTSTVAALLTIMGYSLYDTVIVFDRIRENVPRMPRATFSQIANRSMSEVFTRSLATSFVVLMPVGALMFFGGDTLKDFAFALLVGVASGAYSSIFIATPVLVEWKERELVYMRRRRLVMEQSGGLVPAFASGAVAGAPVMATAAAGTGAGAPAGAPRTPRDSRAARRAGRAATPRPATAPPPPRPTQQPAIPPADAGTTEADKGAAPPPEATQPAPPRPDGDGNGAPASPRTTSTAGSGKPKRQRPRKKHGRR
ncbi:MAG TPA: protein translocase subunit SecD [Thermoleophilaceae bacterium]|nr:protein translocase subunit SecD [Thermoleophilaceae bacterium]